MSYSLRKALFFDLLKAGIVIGEAFVKIFHGVTEFFWDSLSAVNANTMPYVLLGVKGYLPVTAGVWISRDGWWR